MQKFITHTKGNSVQFFELLKQLRPHLTFETFSELINEAKKTGTYELIALEENNNLVALMGYRVICDFVHGRHLYIDDLVTSEKVRSKGYGAILLRHAEGIAKEKGCSNLRLSTGIDNERGKKFYEKNDWNLRSVVYKKKL